MSTNEIRKQALLKASLDRVWEAITNAKAFGIWFGMDLQGEFAPGGIIYGTMVPTQMNPEVAKMQQPFAGQSVELHVQEISPKTFFSFKWHAYVEEGTPLSETPMTLVTFELEEKPDGILLTIKESGFDKIPPSQRKKAFDGNSEGWSIQLTLIEAYLNREE